MKIKCNDGIIREFQVARCDGQSLGKGVRQEGYRNSICEECGYDFYCHDTKVLKPVWRKHICKPQTKRSSP